MLNQCAPSDMLAGVKRLELLLVLLHLLFLQTEVLIKNDFWIIEKYPIWLLSCWVNQPFKDFIQLLIAYCCLQVWQHALKFLCQISNEWIFDCSKRKLLFSPLGLCDDRRWYGTTVYQHGIDSLVHYQPLLWEGAFDQEKYTNLTWKEVKRQAFYLWVTLFKINK